MSGIRRPERFGRVAVLLGGRSAEREISLMSGRAVLEALTARGVDALAVDPGRDVVRQLLEAEVDRVFIALHGRLGEDGTVQGALELAGIPYTGSGVLGSAMALDKLRCKRLWQALGLPTPEYVVLREARQVEGVAEELGVPLFVKPSCEGSSIGMTRVDEAGQLPEAFRAAAEYDRDVIVERCIDGGEYTISVLAGETLPSIRIETPRTFYDYEAKYFTDTTSYHCPSDLDAEEESRFATMALEAFTAVGASGWGRVDFMLDEARRPWLLEVNTIPGMTDHSLVPMAAREAGMDFEDLVWRILETSVDQEVAE